MDTEKDPLNAATESKVLSCIIKDPLELNLAFMPFIVEGGLFVPVSGQHRLDDLVLVDLHLPGRTDPIRIEGKVVWITPQNALHHVLPGIGIQFIGPNAKTTRALIESNLDGSFDVGGYTYGITEASKKK